MTGCTCPEPGWCERHKVHKHEAWHKLCQTRQDYFMAWERGVGPGQVTDVQPSRSTPLKKGGPGTELKRLLNWFGIVDKSGCQCNDHARRMDYWGPDKCQERLDTIVGWLEKEAKERRLPFSRVAGRVLVRWAIRKARRTLSNA